MLIYSGQQLEKYKKENLQIQKSWNKRDFVTGVRTYFHSSVEKVLAVGGLRGTGKTVGILQASEGLDVCYVLAQKGDGKTGADYIEFLRNVDSKYIIIDEYSWISGREDLDRYLITAIQNGKRIAITGTESITLDFLNYGALNHRVSVLHTTLFTYEEYLRLYDKKHSKAVCREYLMEGGLFKEYAIRNFDSMKAYVEEAIVNNLSGYLKDEISEEKAKTLTYSVLYKAICPSNLSSVPTLRKSSVTLSNFLEKIGVNTAIKPEERDLNRVADIFEQIGLIVRVPNYDRDSELREQYYITNPSLTCQLILAAYDLRNIENSILGHVFESCVMVQLAVNKLEDHDIYFFNNGSGYDPNNKELDIIITDKEKEFAYFFECKFSQDDEIRSDITLLSGYLEENYFKHTEIEGRYLVYNGKPCVKEYEVGTVVFTPIGSILDRYFEFQENVEDIARNTVSKDNKPKQTECSNEGETDILTENIDESFTVNLGKETKCSREVREQDISNLTK